MTVPLAQWTAPHLSTSSTAAGDRSVTLTFTDAKSGGSISLTMTVTAAGHLAFLAHGIAIDSAWSDV